MKKDKNKSVTAISIRSGDIHSETIYDPITQTLQFAVKDGGEISYATQFKVNGKQYEPLTQARHLVASGTLRLASKASAYQSVPSLTKKIREFIHRYVDLPPTFELICTYYVLLSWQYDQFNELPYLRVRGDYGSGKTRFLNVVGGLTYNPVFASGASTTAPIFHLLDSLRGTLVLDESDYRYSDATAEITKILNNGHAKGFSVLRCEPVKDGGFIARAYNIFGPKIVAARESFNDHALESRFITCDFDGRSVRPDIPVSLPHSFESEARAIRNQLLWYRLHRNAFARELESSSSAQISPRSRQIYQPLLSMVDDRQKIELISTYIAEQEAQLRSDLGLQTEAEVLSVIAELMGSTKEIRLSEITHQFMLRYKNRYTRRITPKWMGYLLRSKLHLSTRKSNGVYIISEGQTERLHALFRKYDVTNEAA